MTVNSGRLQLTQGAVGSARGVTLGAAATLEIGGSVAPAVVGRLNVSRTMTLGGATLVLQLPALFTASAGTTFTIISNGSLTDVNGTFAGLPEGAIVRANGVRFRISYVGGTGNDVVADRAADTGLPADGRRDRLLLHDRSAARQSE